MTVHSIRLATPSGPPINIQRFTAQLERRGVVDTNSDGIIDGKDAVSAQLLQDLRQAADRNPHGTAGLLEPSELGGLAIQRTFGDRVRALVGMSTRENAATADARQAARRLDDMQDAISYLMSARTPRSLFRAAGAINQAADALESAMDTVGLADDASTRALQRDIEQTERSFKKLLTMSITARNVWVGPYNAAQLRGMGDSLKSIKTIASEKFSVELPAVPVIVR